MPKSTECIQSWHASGAQVIAHVHSGQGWPARCSTERARGRSAHSRSAHRTAGHGRSAQSRAGQVSTEQGMRLASAVQHSMA
eukprot:12420674-Alexandrium_andersonii.AAC.1